MERQMAFYQYDSNIVPLFKELEEFKMMMMMMIEYCGVGTRYAASAVGTR